MWSRSLINKLWAEIIIRLTVDSNGIGPFSIYTGSTETVPLVSGVTRFNLQSGKY